MAAAGGTGGSMPMATPRSFAELISATPQPFPDVLLPSRGPKTMEGEVYFLFSKEEILKSAEPFKFSLVLKFLKQRPSLDTIRLFIKNRWGLSGVAVVSSMRKPRNVFVRLMSEEDFNKAFSREVCDINGVAYRPFHWSPEYSEEEEPPVVPVWIFLPGLAPNFYHPSILKIFTAPIRKFIRCDNSTWCATRTDGARVCLELDAVKSPLSSFCTNCKLQGHNLQMCKKGKIGKEKEKKLVHLEYRAVPKQLNSSNTSGSKLESQEVAVLGMESKSSDDLVL
ncbi:hypothetical protein F2P56_023400, partial [Juglans regia]